MGFGLGVCLEFGVWCLCLEDFGVYVCVYLCGFYRFVFGVCVCLRGLDVIDRIGNSG